MANPVFPNVEGPFKCPFCTGTFSINDPGEDMSQDPAIFHSLPTCKQYDGIQSVEDAIRYMRCTRS